MILDVNPNRMELLRLKKRLVLARRGHKLLKDKQEELMRRFMEQIDEVKSLRRETEKELKQAYSEYLAARCRMSREALTLAVSYPKVRLKVASEVVNVLVNLVRNIHSWSLLEDKGRCYWPRVY